MSIRWTRTTVTAAVAALPFVVVFAATLPLRPEAQWVAAVAAPTPPPASTPATPLSEGEDEHADHDDEPATSTGSGNVAPVGQTPATDEPTETKGSQDAAALAAATTFLSDVEGMTLVPGPVVHHGERAEATF